MRRTSSRRVGRRIARWLLAAALGLELIWLVGVNALLCAHAIPHFVSAHTADVSLDYRRAWSFLPGDLHVRGFWLRGQPGGVEFYVTAEKVSAKVSLLALLRRTFRTDFIHAHGLTFRLRERLSPNQVDAEAAQLSLWPSIPGFGPIPRVPFGPDEDPARPRGNAWAVDLEGVHAEELGEVWLGWAHLEGPGQVDGRLKLVPQTRMEIGPVAVDFPETSLRVGSRVLARKLGFRGRTVVAPYDPRAVKGGQILDALGADLTAQGEIAQLGALQALTGDARPRGTGGFALSAKVRRGVLMPGSHLHSSLHALGARSRTVAVGGEAELSVKVGAQRTDATLSLHRPELVVRAQPGAQLHGGLLELRASVALPALRRPVRDLRATVRVRALRGELAGFSPLLPDAVSILKGEVRVHGELSLHEGGTLHLTTRGLVLGLNQASVPARVTAEVRLKALGQTAFDLAESTLRLRTGEAPGLTDSRGWWLNLRLAQGQVQLGGDGPRGTMELRAQARDGEPLLSLLAANTAVPGLLTGLFKLPHLHLNGTATLRGGVFTLAPVRVAGGSTAVEAALQLAETLNGAVLVRAGPVNLGLWVREGEVSVASLAAQSWFDGELAKLTGPPQSARHARRPPAAARSK